MFGKASIAFVSALAAVAQAHNLHGHEHLHQKRQLFPTANGSGLPLPPGLAPLSTGASGVSPSAPYPTGTGNAPSGAPLSTGGAPLTTGAPLNTGASGSGSGSGSSSADESGDTTLTYTVGTGSSTTVITTTIHRHRTVYQTASAVSPCHHLLQF